MLIAMTAMDLVFRPLRIANSPTAKKAYITTFLFSISAVFLLGIAAFSYLLFYLNYIPKIGIEKTVFLQYGYLPQLQHAQVGRQFEFPAGTVHIETGDLATSQRYDIYARLTVPTSPINRNLGNFMIDVELWSPPRPQPKPTENPTTDTPTPTEPAPQLLYRSTRPAILTYQSNLPSTISTILSTPLYLLGFRREQETLSIRLVEDLTFPRGGVPQSVKIILRDERVQVYDLIISFRARLGGWRRAMYEWPILSFILGTTAFWAVEIVWMGIVWWVLVARRDGGQAQAQGKVYEAVEEERKRLDEEEEESEEETTEGSEQPGRRIKKEEMEEEEEDIEEIARIKREVRLASSTQRSPPLPPFRPAGRGIGRSGWTTVPTTTTATQPPPPPPPPESVREGYAADEEDTGATMTADERPSTASTTATVERASEGEEEEDYVDTTTLVGDSGIGSDLASVSGTNLRSGVGEGLQRRRM